MKLTKEQYEEATWAWLWTMDIICACDMDNVREIFRDSIVSDSEDEIQFKRKNHIFTVKARHNGRFEMYGGQASLETSFKWFDGKNYIDINYAKSYEDQ